MKILIKAALAVFVISMLSLAVSAQRRPTRAPAKPVVVKTPAATSTATQSDAQKVSNQILNVTKFLYLLGGVAKGIEDVDKDQRANRAAITKNAENKKSVVQTIRNLRAGLAALESDFRTKPALRKYLLKIEGITVLCAETEKLAVNGNFSDAGRPLVSVVEKLSDTLAAM